MRVVKGQHERLSLAQTRQDTPRVARWDERRTQGKPEINGLLTRLALLWRMREGAEGLLEGRYGLAIRRAREGAVPGPLPRGQRLGMQASGSIVLRDHFRLRL